MDTSYGIRELRDVNFRALQPMEFNGQTYQAGETIINFEKVNFLSTIEQKNTKSITGGKGNIEFMHWTNSPSCNLYFSQGVFSKRQLSFFSNSKINKGTTRLIHKREVLETDENGQVTIKYEPVQLFVYNANTNERIEYVLDGLNILTEHNFMEVICDYTFEYMNPYTVIQMGNGFYNHYLSLDAKTYVKSTEDGDLVTGIIEIPKLRITSPLQFTLGDKANTPQLEFYGVGVRQDVNSPLANFIILSDNIMADIG